MTEATIAQILLNSPLALLLLWMLTQTQKELAEVRKARDADSRDWVTRYEAMAERVVKAVERLDLPGPL